MKENRASRSKLEAASDRNGLAWSSQSRSTMDEVRTVPAQGFGGREVTDGKLSDSMLGGDRDWQVRQAALERAYRIASEAPNFRRFPGTSAFFRLIPGNPGGHVGVPDCGLFAAKQKQKQPATLATPATLKAGLDDDRAVREAQTGNWKQTTFVNRCSSTM
jgi:hypothetical protein